MVDFPANRWSWLPECNILLVSTSSILSSHLHSLYVLFTVYSVFIPFTVDFSFYIPFELLHNFIFIYAHIIFPLIFSIISPFYKTIFDLRSFWKLWASQLLLLASLVPNKVTMKCGRHLERPRCPSELGWVWGTGWCPSDVNVGL